MVGIPQLGGGGSGGARESGRRRPRPRLDDRDQLLHARCSRAEARERAAGAARSAAVSRHHAKAGSGRRGRALGRREGADSSQSAASRRAGGRARRSQEPPRTLRARLHRFSRQLCHRRRPAAADAAAGADRRHDNGDRGEPGRPRGRSVGPAGNARRRRRARRHPPVVVGRLLVRDQRQRVCHLRPRGAPAARLGRTGVVERTALELGRGAEQAGAGAPSRQCGEGRPDIRAAAAERQPEHLLS